MIDRLSVERASVGPEVGLVLPMKEVKTDGIVEIVEGIGGAIEHFILYDHVILEVPEKPSADGNRLYTSETPFLEPLVLAATLSQVMHKLPTLITSVLVAPQRQTALLAKQVALVCDMSEGAFQLGVGVGWNREEFRALGMDFHKRGVRLDEQIHLLHALWSQDVVTAEIGNEVINQMALNPRPMYKIPIWVGGLSDKAIDRAARLADGWMPLDKIETFGEKKEILRKKLLINSRDIASYKTMGRIQLGLNQRDKWVSDYLEWKDLGVTHIALSTTGQKNDDPNFHMHLLTEFLQKIHEYRFPSRTYVHIGSFRKILEG